MATQTLESQYGQEPLTVDALVPTAALRYHLGRVHVATPDVEVLADIEPYVRKAAATDDRWTDEIVGQTLEAALWIHHEGMAEYRFVMGGCR